MLAKDRDQSFTFPLNSGKEKQGHYGTSYRLFGHFTGEDSIGATDVGSKTQSNSTTLLSLGFSSNGPISDNHGSTYFEAALVSSNAIEARVVTNDPHAPDVQAR